uniref:Guanylate cyclase domain-containing protein n=1 Tax=Dunaliella tertiolecta TaxID=3047 RepID=A0A7S3VQK9_DUNTE
MRLLFLLQLLVSAVRQSCSSQSELVFRVGAVIGMVDQCAEINDAHNGYQLFANMLDNPDTSLFIKDQTGTKHRIRFNYTRYDDNCESEKHNALIQTLINEDKVHFLFGSTPVFAEQESVLANDAQRLLYHCCVGPDPIYEMDMKYIYGIQVSNTKYSQGAAKSMALAGGVTKVFVFYLEDNIFTSTTCKSAIEYSTDVLHELKTGYNITKVIKYTSADAAADPRFYAGLVDQAMSIGADAILGCDFKEPGFQVAKAVADRDYYLKALWLTVAPAYEDFADTLGPDASEFVLTPVQWHPAAKFADPFFGSAAEYSEKYSTTYGVSPSYVAAGASAVGYSLTTAIQDAFKGCTFRNQDADADGLLFDAGLLDCEKEEGENGTGYERVMRSLASQHIDTFFGAIALNSFRRNVALTPITAQVQSGVLQATLPIQVANKALVMPKPSTEDGEESGAEYIGSLQREAFITVVVIVVGSVLVFCLICVIIMGRSRQQSRMLENMLVISPDQLIIINHPVRLCDGSYECGKAMLCNTLVALEPLTEVKQKEMELNTKLGNLHKRPSLHGRASSVSAMKDLESILAGLHGTGLGLSNQSLGVPDNSCLEDDLEAPPSVLSKGVCEGAEDMQPQPLPSPPNRAKAFNGPPPDSHHSRRSKVSFNLVNIPDEEHEDTHPQHNFQVSGASESQIDTQWAETPSLTRAQILRLVWRSKNLQHPSVLPVLGVMWSLPSVPQNMAVLVTECQELGVLSSVMDNKTMELDAVKMLDICKDLAQVLAYLHAQTQPKLRPVLQPRLAGVMLNKHCRAKLRVPFTSLFDALPLDRSGCMDCATTCLKMALGGDASAHRKIPPYASRLPSEGRVGPHLAELEDVQQFGLDIACMLSSSQQVSHMSAARCCDWQKSTTRERDAAEGTVLPKACLNSLVEERGKEIAQLVSQCCAQDSAKRPSFTQIYERLEELGPEMIKRAQVAHRTTRRSPFKTTSSLSLGNNTQHAARADELLYEVFPRKVAETLKSGRFPEPEPYSCVSLFFSDIVGYTDTCSVLSLEEVLDMLHRLYSRFDALSDDLDLFKVGTVGDAYMCVANVRHPMPDTHAAAMARFAFGCGEIAKSEPISPRRPELGNIRIRMGIHAGPVMGAVVGTMNRRFCLFGDTVNVASRMESTSLTDHIQCSAPFIRLLQQQWPECAMLAVPQGARSIKGKGRMHTFYLFPDEQHRQASECQAASVESSSLLSPPKSSGALAERSSPAVLAKYLSASPEKSCPVALVKCRASMESSGPSVMAKRATSCSEGLVLEGRSGQLMLAGKGDPSSHGCWYGYEGCLEVASRGLSSNAE